jgi:CheY-like chemotaxis protein
VAHDFNNVLSAIVGYGELAHNAVAAESPARTHIDRLLSATERARLLVRRVLTFNPQRSVNYQALSIRPIIEEVLEQLQATISPVKVITHGMDTNATILGDTTEVYQVVMNLCSNAVRAMPSGGTLELKLQSVAVSEANTLALGQLRPGRWLCLLISVTGTGMSAEQLTSIFEPFYTTREPGQGTGIGLTVVRNIVLSMRGALDVASHPGSGTRISVYWPLIEAAASTEAANNATNESQGSGETIMVVDDDAELVMLAEELLASLGYEPVGFTSAPAALEAFRRDPDRFDAVLSDERMQPLRGCEFGQSIHDIEPTMPVILMTGHHDADIDRRARQAGIVAILDKPLRSETLRAALARQTAPRQLPSTS